MLPEEVGLIAHGFGKDDDDRTEVKLGHLLEKLFITSPKQPFKHIALLDTPGYSKADLNSYSKKTDKNIARIQLNSANFILWFVPADLSTITESDIDFLYSLDPAIPKLIILNKADKIDIDEIDDVVEKIRRTLERKGIQVLDVLAYSIYDSEEYDMDKIMQYLKKWDKAVPQSRFAYNFKVLFTRCKDYYEQMILERRKYLSRINKSVAYSDHEFVLTFLDELKKKTTDEIKEYKRMEETLSELSDTFFKEIKNISDIVGIDMPEPTEIDLIDDRLEEENNEKS